MAVIEERKTKDGVTRYRVKIRLKGYSPQTETHEQQRETKKTEQKQNRKQNKQTETQIC